MLCLGKVNSLYVFKKIAHGLILKDVNSDDEVLLPNQYVAGTSRS